MKREELVIGKRYWIVSINGKPIRRKLRGFSNVSKRVWFSQYIGEWNKPRHADEVFRTRKECLNYINLTEEQQ